MIAGANASTSKSSNAIMDRGTCSTGKRLEWMPADTGLLLEIVAVCREKHSWVQVGASGTNSRKPFGELRLAYSL